jgi:hypothetical protein
MRKVAFLCWLILPFVSFSQDSSICKCTFTYSVNYPKKAAENGICGEVIIEMNMDSTCLYSNPVVKKGLGFGCDEEALRITKSWITAMNKCYARCKPKGCRQRIVTQKITFQCVEE